MFVNNMNEAEELWEVAEDSDEEATSVLADADYSEAEKINPEDHFGDKFNEKLVNDSKGTVLYKEYKV
jgi:hypothetical protein